MFVLCIFSQWRFIVHGKLRTSKYEGHADSITDAFALHRLKIEKIISIGLMDPITQMTARKGWIEGRDHAQWNAILSCKNDAMKIFDYIRELVSLKLWPVMPVDCDLDTVINSLYRFENKDEVQRATGTQGGPSAASNYSSWCNACICATDRRMISLTAEIMTQASGLCLDYARAGVDQACGKGCHIKH